MGQRFPAVTARQIIPIIRKLGFEFSRHAGSSHAIYKRAADNRRTIVPIHAGTILKRKTLKSILNDLSLSVEEFRKLL